jgi:WD40 repeat protein
LSSSFSVTQSRSRVARVFLIALAFILARGEPARAKDEPPVRAIFGGGAGAGSALPLGAVFRLGGAPFTASYEYKTLTYSPDGKRLLSTHPGGAAIVWDAATGARVLTLLEDRTYVESATFLGNDRIVVAWGSRKVAAYAIATAQELHRFDASTGLSHVVSSPDATRVVSALGDIRLWDAATGKMLATYERPANHSMGGSGTRFEFVDNGRLLLIASTNGGAALVHAASLKAFATPLFPAQLRAGAAAVSPDGKVAALVRRKEPFGTFDVKTGAARPALNWNGKPPDNADYLSFSPDGRFLAALTSPQIRLYDIRGGRELPPLQSRQRHAKGLTWSPDTRVLIAHGARQVPEFWDLADPAAPKMLHGSDTIGTGVFTIGVSPDGREIAAGDNTGQLTRWDIQRGVMLARRPGVPGERGREEALHQLAYRPDGRLIEAVTYAGRFESLDRRTLAPSGVVKSPGAEAAREAFSPDFRLVAQATRDRAVRVWDRATGRQVHLFSAGPTKDSIGGVAFSGDGRRLAIAHGTSVRVYHLDKSRDPIAQFEARHSAPLGRTAFSPNGSTLAAGEQNGLWLWDLRSGQLRWNHRSTGWALSISYSPDGLMLAAPAETDVLLVDVPTGAVVAQLPGHTGTIYTVRFLPDGLRFVSGSQDASVIVWDLRRALAQVAGAPAVNHALKAQWAALGGEDVPAAYRAATALLQRPGDVLPRAREILRANEGTDRWARLIEELSSDDAKQRDRAHLDLERGGAPAAAAVREALRDPPEGEAGDRLASLARLFNVRPPDDEPPAARRPGGDESGRPEPDPVMEDAALRLRVRTVQLVGWIRAASSPGDAVAGDAEAILAAVAGGGRNDLAAAAARALLARPVPPPAEPAPATSATTPPATVPGGAAP